ncbi:hypothetical protein FGW20_00120 [Methanoculleus sp. FWC-SCC3]|uniref:Secreted protein n=1 Tax=Methanoculleus methanifontis TaxID=2584086 RepID=A0ABT8LXS0_9EURY|nr:hypothetical protein [Methanoculleus sp. FWC-SCC3]MDN7011467.1 hypothetical protein [Methanoculleus sp. FWC-SCC3]
MKQNKIFGACAAAVVGLLLVCMAVVPVSAENGICAVGVPGGSLLIDETKGVDCTASAGSYIGPYVPGVTYQIVANCKYFDTNDVIGGTAEFRLKGSDGTEDTKIINDILVMDNSWEGTLSVLFTPDSPGAYHWDITCIRGSESATSRGDLILS